MTAAWGVWAHAVLALILLGSLGAARSTRARLIEIVSAAGFVVALASAGSPPVWRALGAFPGRWQVVAVAIGVSWLMVAATDRGVGRVETAALTALSATALAFFAATSWLTPALVFWGCSALALGALIHLEALRDPWLIGLLAAGDALFIAGAIVDHVVQQSWILSGAGIVTAGLWLGSAFLRGWLGVALIPATSDVRAAPAIPLVLAGGLLVLGRTEEAFSQGVVLLALFFAVVVGLLATTSPQRPAVVGAWVVTAALALVIAVPHQSTRAAVAAILGAAGAGLWRLTEGRGHYARALLFGLMPFSVGYGAVALSYADLFSPGRGALRFAAASLALLGIIAALGMVIPARAARGPRSDDWHPIAWLATLTLAALSVWQGIPISSSGSAALPLGVPGVVTVLYVVVVAFAGAAFALSLRLASSSSPPVPVEPSLEPAAESRIGHSSAPLLPALLVWGAGFAAILWMTIAGLRVGFL